MKRTKLPGTILLTLFGVVLAVINSCKKDEINNQKPIITNILVDNIGTQLTMSASLQNNGEEDITSIGFCLDTIKITTKNNKNAIISGKSTNNKVEQFSLTQFNLLPNKKYYIRPFAEYKNGLIFGEEVSILTGPVYTNYLPIFDFEGNSYKTIKIGSQIWMAENLKSTLYNDGTIIHNIENDSDWLQAKTPSFCWLDNNISNKNRYGALYNWKVVQTGKLAPSGWRVPTDADWEKLFQYLGGKVIAGAKMKDAGTAHWSTPNSGATNESGWSGLPGMFRHWWGPFPSTSETHFPGVFGYFWSATSMATHVKEANFISLGHTLHDVYIGRAPQAMGFSVRCIKD